MAVEARTAPKMIKTIEDRTSVWGLMASLLRSQSLQAVDATTTGIHGASGMAGSSAFS